MVSCRVLSALLSPDPLSLRSLNCIPTNQDAGGRSSPDHDAVWFDTRLQEWAPPPITTAASAASAASTLPAAPAPRSPKQKHQQKAYEQRVACRARAEQQAKDDSAGMEEALKAIQLQAQEAKARAEEDAMLQQEAAKRQHLKENMQAGLALRRMSPARRRDIHPHERVPLAPFINNADPPGATQALADAHADLEQQRDPMRFMVRVLCDIYQYSAPSCPSPTSFSYTSV